MTPEAFDQMKPIFIKKPGSSSALPVLQKVTLQTLIDQLLHCEALDNLWSRLIKRIGRKDFARERIARFLSEYIVKLGQLITDGGECQASVVDALFAAQYSIANRIVEKRSWVLSGRSELMDKHSSDVLSNDESVSTSDRYTEIDLSSSFHFEASEAAISAFLYGESFRNLKINIELAITQGIRQVAPPSRLRYSISRLQNALDILKPSHWEPPADSRAKRIHWTCVSNPVPALRIYLSMPANFERSLVVDPYMAIMSSCTLGP